MFGPFAGTFADAFDKKVVLNISQVLFALGALFLGVVAMLGIVQYWEMVAVALLFGVVSAFETPTRQSVRRCRGLLAATRSATARSAQERHF